MPITVNMPK